MILIADSGATSSNWRLIDPKGEISQFKISGFNPYYQERDALDYEIGTILLPQIKEEIKHLFYYGAGCGSGENKELVRGVLSIHFRKANIEVHDDMIAAARALCGHDAGIACILGTGANSCYYDGTDRKEHVASLGYVLGDEGSGTYLGKLLLADYLRNDLPTTLSEKFKKRFNLDIDEVLDRVYHKELPGRYMASFAKFLFQNIKEPYSHRLVSNAFSLFFDKNVLKYPQAKSVPIHFSGSVAFYFGNILRQVSNDKGVVVRNIIESPIAGLTLYHKSQFFKV